MEVWGSLGYLPRGPVGKSLNRFFPLISPCTFTKNIHNILQSYFFGSSSIVGGGFKNFLFSPYLKRSNLTCAFLFKGVVQPPRRGFQLVCHTSGWNSSDKRNPAGETNNHFNVCFGSPVKLRVGSVPWIFGEKIPLNGNSLCPFETPGGSGRDFGWDLLWLYRSKEDIWQFSIPWIKTKGKQTTGWLVGWLVI